MSDLAEDGLPPLREVIARHGLSAKKALGQNFLLDLNLTGRIARAGAPLDETEVLEVGPGPGGLTRALLMNGAKRVVAIERDARCLDALAEIAAHYPGRLTVIEGDAMEIDPTAHLTGPAQIIANLPYNVGTALFTGWMSGPWPPWWQRLTLMFQREVAERIVAAPGSGAYGRLSVLAGWRAEARIAFDVSPRAFTPPPKVTSSVVSVTPKAPIVDVDGEVLARVTGAAFGQRRKMLRQSLKALGQDSSALLDAAGIDGTRRAETLTIEEFCALTTAVDR